MCETACLQTQEPAFPLPRSSQQTSQGDSMDEGQCPATEASCDKDLPPLSRDTKNFQIAMAAGFMPLWNGIWNFFARKEEKHLKF